MKILYDIKARTLRNIALSINNDWWMERTNDHRSVVIKRLRDAKPIEHSTR